MVREYMAPFINFVYLKSAFIKHPTSVKKENFWMTHSSPPSPFQWIWEMVRKYPPKKENGQGIYGSLYKVSLPESQFAKHTTKSAFIKHPTSVKKENFWMTHSSPPSPFQWIWEMVRKYPPKKENGQGIYGSLYKVSLPESQFAKHTTLGFPLKKSYPLTKVPYFCISPKKFIFSIFGQKSS